MKVINSSFFNGIFPKWHLELECGCCKIIKAELKDGYPQEVRCSKHGDKNEPKTNDNGSKKSSASL